MKLFVSLVVAAAVTLVSCSAQEDAELAERAAARFHEQFNAAEFAAIYADGDAVLREDGETEFIRMMWQIREKLGEMRSSELVSSTWQIGNIRIGERILNGTIMVRTYHTEFTHSSATLVFTWRIAEGRARLIGFDVEAD